VRGRFGSRPKWGAVFVNRNQLLLNSKIMRIKIINPNTTGSMTERMGLYAQRIAAPGTEIVAVSPDFGPPSIEDYYDEALAVPGLLAANSPGRG
jgi:Asp/Glu/Hydantoin racemase